MPGSSISAVAMLVIGPEAMISTRPGYPRTVSMTYRGPSRGFQAPPLHSYPALLFSSKPTLCIICHLAGQADCLMKGGIT